MSIYNSHNWLFVSFEQGAGGHRIARELAKADDVYWYAHPDNDMDETSIIQRQGSKYHFNRYTEYGHLPPPYDYIKDYIDEETYYRDIFEPKFIEAKGHELLEKYKLPYPTHMLPYDILKKFPNASIVNVIAPVEKLVERYINVAVEFPGFVKHRDFLPPDNARVKFLQSIYDMKKDFKTKDVWAMDNYNELWNDSMYDTLREQKLKEFTQCANLRTGRNDRRIKNEYINI